MVALIWLSTLVIILGATIAGYRTSICRSKMFDSQLSARLFDVRGYIFLFVLQVSHGFHFNLQALHSFVLVIQNLDSFLQALDRPESERLRAGGTRFEKVQGLQGNVRLVQVPDCLARLASVESGFSPTDVSSDPINSVILDDLVKSESPSFFKLRYS